MMVKMIVPFAVILSVLFLCATARCDERSVLIPARYERASDNAFLCVHPCKLAQIPADATLFVAGTNKNIRIDSVSLGDVESYDLDDGSVVHLAMQRSAWLQDQDEVALVVATKLRAKFLYLDLSRKLIVMTAGVDEHSCDFAVRIILENEALMTEANKELEKLDTSSVGALLAGGRVAPQYDELNGALILTESNGDSHTVQLPSAIIKNTTQTISPWLPLSRPINDKTKVSGEK